MTDLLRIGLKSLMTYQSAIQITAQNIQNARTAFYSRQQISFVESMFNGGVDIGDVNRIYDETANQNLLRCGSALSNIGMYLQNISDFEKVLDNDGTSINKYINDSLTALQELTKNAGSAESRSAYLSRLSSLATQFNALGADIANRKQVLNQNMQTTVGQANDLLSAIGTLNQQIAETQSDQQAPLLDQRNALVHDLAKYMNINATTDASNMMTINLVNGSILLTGSQVNLLSTSTDPKDPSNLQIMIGINNTLQNITSNITGGELYGMIQMRNNALDTAEAGLNRMAIVFASAFNAQNKLGIDNYGNLGGNVFLDINDPSLLAARVNASTNNTGSGNISVTINNAGQLAASDYQLVFSDATHYSLVRTSDQSVVSQGAITSYPAVISADGFTATIASGSFNAGDTYTLSPTAGAMNGMHVTMTDPGKLALGFPVSAAASQSNTGQGTINVDAILDTTNSAFQTSGQLNPPIKIVFLSDNTYQIMNANSNAVMEGPITYTPGTAQSVFPTPGGYDPGYRISIRGNVAAGDTFNIGYNTNVSGDNRNALQLANLYNTKLVGNGQMTFNEAYRMTATDISMKTNLAKSKFDSAQIVFYQADMRYNEISGVSEIEEMNNLAQYQEAYQACAQVIQVAKNIFDTLLTLSE